MTTQGPRNHTYEVNAIMWVSRESEEQIKEFFSDTYGVKKNRLQSNLHLTVYHGRRPLPGIQGEVRPVSVIANAAETRFMVLAPGGENPRKEIDPRSHSLGVRLTRRNLAIPEIQSLRKEVYSLETNTGVGNRIPTTAWTNCFGSRNYQPHIQLLRPWHKVEATLTELGLLFRARIEQVEFDWFQVEERRRVGGEWVPGRFMQSQRGLNPVLSSKEAVQ